MSLWHSRVSKFSVLICKTNVQVSKQINKKNTKTILKRKKEKITAVNVQLSVSANRAVEVRFMPLLLLLNLQSPFGSARTPKDSGKAVRIHTLLGSCSFITTLFNMGWRPVSVPETLLPCFWLVLKSKEGVYRWESLMGKGITDPRPLYTWLENNNG